MVSLLLFCHFKRKLYSQHNPIVPRLNGGEKKNAIAADALPWEFLGYFCSLRFSVGFLHFSGWASLVTQPKLQRRPNCMELRSMDSYIQIVYGFQKCKRKVPSTLLLSYEKSPFIPPKKDEKNLPLGGNGGGIFCLLFHSSLLSVFGLNATSPYNSYLPLIFGKFALI